MSGKKIETSEQENQVLENIQSAFDIKQWTAENVLNIQRNELTNSMPNKIVNMMKKIDQFFQEKKISEKIERLADIKIPSSELIAIFNKLGESFSSESGILPIGNDISYLTKLLEGDNMLTDDERQTAKSALEEINQQVVELEGYWDEIQKKIAVFQSQVPHLVQADNSNLSEKQILQKDRFQSLMENISTKIREDEISIMSVMTTNLNDIIPRIRECLGCLKKECNNDTNLSFADGNRFFLYSQAEGGKIDFSDQLVHYLPTQQGDMFIMDLLYGERSVDVFVSHIGTVLKKIGQFEIPQDHTIFLPEATLKSVYGSDVKELEKKLAVYGDILFGDLIELKITVPKSSVADNYIEFGGGLRETGERTVSGYCLNIKKQEKMLDRSAGFIRDMIYRIRSQFIVKK
ncbi:hypothetical protein COB57_03095 [Candidatus Peregrinibacteria bacterium]|nr:MAG: hypothetical protein COB57_03095 [Candidatus Peregrinibacteria bacterium]